MGDLNPVLIGVTLALAASTVGVMALLSPKNRPAFAYAQLLLMVGIYVGFAIIAFDAKEFPVRADWSILLVESLTALVFLVLGLAALSSSRPWILGALILAHGGVDLLHLLMNAAHSPEWYAFLCIVYDAIAGVAAIYFLSPDLKAGQTVAEPR